MGNQSNGGDLSEGDLLYPCLIQSRAGCHSSATMKVVSVERGKMGRLDPRKMQKKMG